MQKSIHTQARELKDLIQQGALRISPFLTDFAEFFAFNPSLKNEALLLELNYTNATDLNEKVGYHQEIIDLVDKIVLDYLENTEAMLLEYFKDEAVKKQLKENRVAKEQAAVVFECRNLGKRFNKNGFHLEGVDLQLRIGEITGVVGENGNGKTTLFRICVGDLQHTEGELRYPDLKQMEWNRISWYPIKKQIAFIPQELPKWHGSLRNNLHLEATLHGFKGKINMDSVNYILNRMDLGNHADKSWAELSGGYKLRFSLAKALIGKPRLLVIDEPLANLDINAQTIVLNDLKDLVESRIFPVSVMISSQHLHEIERVADNLLYLKEGKEIYNGKTAEFGKERLENCFEIECGLTQQVFEEKLKGFAYNSVLHNGQVLIIRTPLHVEEKDLLQFLLVNDIKITYFRNISQSIKKYFV